MTRAVQKRTLETRARLVAAAEAVIAEAGFEAMRVEEVVLRAGTAKGTFFAHFKDKDALMDLIIGARMETYLGALDQQPVPSSVEDMVEALEPLCSFMTSERYVFDVLMRYSGATSIETIGAIATSFGRQVEVFERWVRNGRHRQDISAELQAEGIQAFLLQAMAAQFCALHNATTFHDRLVPYLEAWLSPKN